MGFEWSKIYYLLSARFADVFELFFYLDSQRKEENENCKNKQTEIRVQERHGRVEILNI